MVNKVIIVPKGQDAEEVVRKLKKNDSLKEIFRKSSSAFIDVCYEPELENEVKAFCDKHDLELHDVPKASIP